MVHIQFAFVHFALPFFCMMHFGEHCFYDAHSVPPQLPEQFSCPPCLLMLASLYQCFMPNTIMGRKLLEAKAVQCRVGTVSQLDCPILTDRNFPLLSQHLEGSGSSGRGGGMTCRQKPNEWTCHWELEGLALAAATLPHVLSQSRSLFPEVGQFHIELLGNRKLVVPQPLQAWVMRFAHDPPLANHQAEDHTYVGITHCFTGWGSEPRSSDIAPHAWNAS